ncbi:MAG: hypothetical protein WKF63_10930, partial [Thermomicrobiales bacterium]
MTDHSLPDATTNTTTTARSTTAPSRPLLDCDIVMKGGITSGVVYPKAMVRIARDYRIHAIGGTSVGAIGAVLTAAAEYWRRTNPGPAVVQQAQIERIVTALDRDGDPAQNEPPGPGWDNWTRPDIQEAEGALLDPANGGQGYAGLYAIPGEVGVDLLGKFHPTPRTKGIFQFLIGILAAPTTIARISAGLLRQFYLIRALTALVACLLTLAFVREPWLGIVPLGAIVVLGLASLFWERLEGWIASRRPAAEPATTAPRGTVSAEEDREQEHEQERDRLMARGVTAGTAGAVLIILVLFIQAGLGWGLVFDWAGENWLFTLVIALLLGVVANGDGAKRWYARWRAPGDADAQGTILARLNLVLIVASVVVLLGLLGWQWEAISDHWGTFGTIVVGVTLGWLLGGLIGILLNALVFISANDNGICTGLDVPDSRVFRWFPWLKSAIARLPGYQARSIALTNWLTAKIDTVGGVANGHHLTFGDLDDAIYVHPNDDETGIDLEVITTELRRGLPLNIPGALYRYGFKPGELLRFFPRSVVAMLLEPGADAGSMELTRFSSDRGRLPIVIAARMSMSFPVLFSTVPVYHIGARDDPSRLDQERVQAPLSDGGIVSNFPIHKFDRALSPWPTFAIDLIEFDTARPPLPSDGDFRINRIPPPGPSTVPPQDNARMVAATTDKAPITGLVALFSRILNTARGWMDNSQKTLPGYTERIVGIHLYQGEGGLNLTMSHDTIERLANRGMRGVDRLVKSWNPTLGATSQWHQHRWLRYRILMRSLENIGQEWKARYTALDLSGEPS